VLFIRIMTGISERPWETVDLLACSLGVNWKIKWVCVGIFDGKCTRVVARLEIHPTMR
jgi:hypothetical protein